MSKDEKTLVFDLKKGSKSAVQIWFKQYFPKMLNYALTRVSNQEIAEEIVQESFINCLKNLHFFQEKSSLWTWMVSILKHEIADHYRKVYAKKAIKLLPIGDFILGKEDDLGSLLISDSHEVSERVRNTFAQMSDYYRELLYLKYVDNKKVKEIARELKKTVKSIESDLFRARNEFRELWSLSPTL